VIIEPPMPPQYQMIRTLGRRLRGTSGTVSQKKAAIFDGRPLLETLTSGWQNSADETARCHLGLRWPDFHMQIGWRYAECTPRDANL
jgi:hypothetical protein